MRLTVLGLFVLALGATPAEAAQRALGVVPLKLTDASASLGKSANGQLRSTLAAISNEAVAEIDLPAGRQADDPETLRELAGLNFIDRIVGGELKVVGETGVVRLVAVDADKTKKPNIVEIALPSTRQEELLSAIEAGVCRAIGDASGASGCQGAIAIEGEVGKDAELLIDGRSVPSSDFIADIPVALGPHKVQLRASDLISQERRLHVHYDSTVKLRIEKQCNQLFILDEGENAGCSATLPLDIASTFIATPPEKLNWPAIGTTAVGIAIVAVGAVFATQAQFRADDINAGHGGPGLTDADLQKLEQMRSSAQTANLLFAAGGLVTAGGVGLFFFEF